MVHHPKVAPPASQCPSKTDREDQPGGHSGIGAPSGVLESSSTLPQENTCVVTQLCQYLSEPGPQGNEPRLEKMTSGSELQ
jgi:hypothetical protein